MGCAPASAPVLANKFRRRWGLRTGFRAIGAIDRCLSLPKLEVQLGELGLRGNPLDEATVMAMELTPAGKHGGNREKSE